MARFAQSYATSYNFQLGDVWKKIPGLEIHFQTDEGPTLILAQLHIYNASTTYDRRCLIGLAVDGAIAEQDKYWLMVNKSDTEYKRASPSLWWLKHLMPGFHTFVIFAKTDAAWNLRTDSNSFLYGEVAALRSKIAVIDFPPWEILPLF